MSNVSGVIKSIQDIMRKDVGVDGDAQRISQLVWMFFLKIYDDREAELELLEDDYQSPLPEELRWRNWAKDAEGLTGDGLSEFVNLQLFPTLKEKLVLQGAVGARAAVIRNVFEDAYNYMKSGTLMRQVINKICEIDFNNTADRHTFGNIYEQLLKDLQSAGNAGEFYTPRAVTQFIVNRIDPKLDESVLDPACGTGGFLSCTIDHKREHYVTRSEDEEVLQKSIHGVEKKALPHMLCTTNMILHGIDTPTNIEHKNTLSRPYVDYGPKDQLDVIITNPPFGVFAPYTSIKTNILFFSKGKPTEHIWYYEHPYPEGVKSYNKTKPMRFEEFQTEIDWWGDEADGFASRVETEQAWKVSLEEIKASNYNLDIKNPHVGEQINHDPEELLQQYQVQQATITGLRSELKDILQKALSGEA